MNTRHNLNRLAYFVATVEEGTITAAAQRLALSKAVVSKQLQLLEKDVGVALLQRNTRHLQPTDAGLVFFDKSKSVLDQADEAFDAVLERGQVPTGKIRITAPVDYGVSHVAPMIARFCASHHRVEIELTLTDDQVDIVEQRYDIAFRIGWLRDSSNIARKLQSFNEIAVCSPTTRNQYKVKKPQDLVAVPYIANKAIGGHTRHEFKRGKQAITVDPQLSISTNVTLAIRSAVISGKCFAIIPDFLAAAELSSGTLVKLLPGWTLRTGGVYAVSPPSRLRASAIRAFLDMAQQEHDHPL